MMIHIYDVLTGEKIQSFEDSEVKPAIEAARAAGKIVNQELDDAKKDVQIFVLREETSNRDIYTVKTAATQEALERFGEEVTKAAQKLTEDVLPHVTEAIKQVAKIAANISAEAGSKAAGDKERREKHGSI